MRDGRLQRVQAIVQRQQRVAAKRGITASSSTPSAVERGVRGPVGKSATLVRFFHFATVSGLIP
jgi:hypothetical protein